MSTVEPVIEVNGLSRTFADKTVLRGVSMRVFSREIVGLVGANGGGKTTTLRMIAGLLCPSEGSGQVLGQNVTRPRRQNRSSIGYMTQALALYPELTVVENLTFRAKIHDVVAQVSTTIERFGLTSVMNQKVANLSGGWARRAQFAASVIHKPALVLLDEPTSGLDALTRHEMWDWIEALAAEGSAILISTHDLAEAERFPSIIHYQDGRAEGPMHPSEFVTENGEKTLEAAIISRARAKP